MNVCKFFRRASAPALQTSRGNIPTAEHFPWNTVVLRRRRDRFHPPGESGLATESRKTQSGVNEGYALRYIRK